LASCSIQEASLFAGDMKKKKTSNFRARKALSSNAIAEEGGLDTDDTVNVLSTTTAASMSSSSFTIPRRCTIESDVNILNYFL